MTGAAPADALAHAIRGHPWLYPAAEVVHLWGVVTVAGAAILFDLRVLGVIRAAALPALARQLLPWSLAGLLLVVPSGMTLFAADPFAILANSAFRWKMLLLCAVAGNALLFHLGPSRSSLLESAMAVPLSARLQAAASLALWLAIVACGRLIAYA